SRTTGMPRRMRALAIRVREGRPLTIAVDPGRPRLGLETLTGQAIVFELVESLVHSEDSGRISAVGERCGTEPALPQHFCERDVRIGENAHRSKLRMCGALPEIGDLRRTVDGRVQRGPQRAHRR